MAKTEGLIPKLRILGTGPLRRTRPCLLLDRLRHRQLETLSGREPTPSPSRLQSPSFFFFPGISDVVGQEVWKTVQTAPAAMVLAGIPEYGVGQTSRLPAGLPLAWPEHSSVSSISG